MRKWDLKKAADDAAELPELLDAGWEPFAAIVEHWPSISTDYDETFEQGVVYLRRPHNPEKPSARRWTPGFPPREGQWFIAAEDLGPLVIDVYINPEDLKLYCDHIHFCGQPLEEQLADFVDLEHATVEIP